MSGPTTKSRRSTGSGVTSQRPGTVSRTQPLPQEIGCRCLASRGQRCRHCDVMPRSANVSPICLLLVPQGSLSPLSSVADMDIYFLEFVLHVPQINEKWTMKYSYIRSIQKTMLLNLPRLCSFIYFDYEALFHPGGPLRMHSSGRHRHRPDYCNFRLAPIVESTEIQDTTESASATSESI